MKYPEDLQALIAFFKKFPGVGKRTAERFAFDLLGWTPEELASFGDLLKTIQTKVPPCPNCGCLFDRLIGGQNKGIQGSPGGMRRFCDQPHLSRPGRPKDSLLEMTGVWKIRLVCYGVCPINGGEVALSWKRRCVVGDG